MRLTLAGVGAEGLDRAGADVEELSEGAVQLFDISRDAIDIPGPQDRVKVEMNLKDAIVEFDALTPAFAVQDLGPPAEVGKAILLLQLLQHFGQGEARGHRKCGGYAEVDGSVTVRHPPGPGGIGQVHALGNR